jgi:DNA-binding response OmpR family regulator
MPSTPTTPKANSAAKKSATGKKRAVAKRPATKRLAAPKAKPTAKRPIEPAKRRPRIMIVDDNEFLALTLEAKLNREGFEAHYLTDPKQLIKVYKRFRPHALIVDVLMNGGSNIGMVRSIRSQKDPSNLCIMALSNFGDIDVREACEHVGVDTFVVKTQVTFQDMVSRIKRLLKKQVD